MIRLKHLFVSLILYLRIIGTGALLNNKWQTNITRPHDIVSCFPRVSSSRIEFEVTRNFFVSTIHGIALAYLHGNHS